MLKGNVVFLLMILFFSLTVRLAANESLSFQWAFLYREKGEERIQSLDITSPQLSLPQGGRIKLMVEPLDSVYIYILTVDSAGILRPLFPYSFALFDDPFYTQNRFLIPGGENWLSLPDSPGTEKFIILASVEREQDIEKQIQLLVKYYRKKQEKYIKISAGLQKKISVLTKSHSRLTSVPEKPVPMAGRIRGNLMVDDEDCFLVENDGFYAKTIKVVH